MVNWSAGERERESGPPSISDLTVVNAMMSYYRMVKRIVLIVTDRNGMDGIQTDMEKSMESFRRATEKGDPVSTVCYTRGLMQQNRFEEALEWSMKLAADERVVHLDEVAKCQLNVANVFFAWGEFRQAMFWVTRAKENGCSSVTPLINVIESIIWKQCGCCDKPAPLDRCSACQAIAFCDAACQRADWKRHKKLAKTFQVSFQEMRATMNEVIGCECTLVLRQLMRSC